MPKKWWCMTCHMIEVNEQSFRNHVKLSHIKDNLMNADHSTKEMEKYIEGAAVQWEKYRKNKEDEEHEIPLSREVKYRFVVRCGSPGDIWEKEIKQMLYKHFPKFKMCYTPDEGRAFVDTETKEFAMIAINDLNGRYVGNYRVTAEYWGEMDPWDFFE